MSSYLDTWDVCKPHNQRVSFSGSHQLPDLLVNLYNSRSGLHATYHANVLQDLLSLCQTNECTRCVCTDKVKGCCQHIAHKLYAAINVGMGCSHKKLFASGAYPFLTCRAAQQLQPQQDHGNPASRQGVQLASPF